MMQRLFGRSGMNQNELPCNLIAVNNKIDGSLLMSICNSYMYQSALC